MVSRLRVDGRGVHNMKKFTDIIKDVNKAYEKQQELATLCSEYNSLAVGNIKNIYKDKNIFPNMEI